MISFLGDNLPMDFPPPKPHDIVLHGHIIPAPTNGKHTLGQLHAIELPRTIRMAPLVVGPGTLVGSGCALGAHPTTVRFAQSTTRRISANAPSHVSDAGSLMD